MKKISPARFNLIVDNIYKNCQRVSFERRSIAQLAKDSGTSVNTVAAVRQLLSDAKLLIIEGNCRSQTTTWHPNKSVPNPAMLTKLYESFIHFESRVKVVNGRKPGKVSLESALRTLVQLGYTGVISKSKHSGYSIITESIDLSKIEVEG